MTNLDIVFLALSHPIRRGILESLGMRSQPFTYLAARYQISLQGITKHIKLLEEAGLVRTYQSGRNKYVSLEIDSLKTVREYASGFIENWDDDYQNFKKNMESTHIGPLSYAEEQD